jgi:hypothetical protein
MAAKIVFFSCRAGCTLEDTAAGDKKINSLLFLQVEM